MIKNLRFLKILEMFQYSIIFYVLTLIIVKFFDKYIFKGSKDEIKKMSKIKLIFSIFIDLLTIVLLLFIIREVALLIPSLSHYINPNFNSHSTIEYVIHIITIFILLETLKNLHFKIKILKEVF